MDELSCELLDQDITEAKLDELKKVEHLQRYKDEEERRNRNGARLAANGFQEPKQVSSNSLTVGEEILLIATRNCLCFKPCDWQMQLMKVVLLN